MALNKKKGNGQEFIGQINTFAKNLDYLRGLDENSYNQKAKRNKIQSAIRLMDNIIACNPQEDQKYKGDDRAALLTKFEQDKKEFLARKAPIEQKLKVEEEKFVAEEREAAQKAAAELNVQFEQPRQLTEEEMLNNQLEFTERQVAEIVEDQKALKETTEALKQKIDEQHEVVIKVDNTVEEAKNEMVSGNEDLEIAKKNQPKCRI